MKRWRMQWSYLQDAAQPLLIFPHFGHLTTSWVIISISNNKEIKNKDSDQPIYLVRSTSNFYNNISTQYLKIKFIIFLPKAALPKASLSVGLPISSPTWGSVQPTSFTHHRPSTHEMKYPFSISSPSPLFSAPTSMTQHLWHHLLFGLPASSLGRFIPSLMFAARIFP